MNNDTFSLSRLGQYFLKHYWENRGFYTLLLLSTTGWVVLQTAEFNLFSTQTLTTDEWGADIAPNFNALYTMGLIVFSLIFLSCSMKGTSNSLFSAQEMLLPASNLERYLFMVINSTIVPCILFSALFSLVALYTETLYLYSDTSCVARGLFAPAIEATEGLVHRSQFSLLSLPFLELPEGKNGVRMLLAVFSFLLYTFGAALWGGVTFKSRPLMKSVLLHGLLMGVGITATVFVTTRWIVSRVVQGSLAFSTPFVSVERLDWMIYLAPLPGILYLVVCWMKLKKLEVMGGKGFSSKGRGWRGADLLLVVLYATIALAIALVLGNTKRETDMMHQQVEALQQHNLTHVVISDWEFPMHVTLLQKPLTGSNWRLRGTMTPTLLQKAIRIENDTLFITGKGLDRGYMSLLLDKDITVEAIASPKAIIKEEKNDGF